MNLEYRAEVIRQISQYQLPRYAEIPNVGLYLNQVAKYINEYLEPFCEMTITESMISNYVKKHLVANPVKKQYNREQIAYLIFIAITKCVLSMDHIQSLFDMQKAAYDSQTAYDYFCCEFENSLQYVFGLKETLDEIGGERTEAKMLCRDVIITSVRRLYLDYCFYVIGNRADEKGEE